MRKHPMLMFILFVLLVLFGLYLLRQREERPEKPETITVEVDDVEETVPKDPKLKRSAFDPELVSWEGGLLRYPGAVNGIDVSSHQGEVDWQAVREAGTDFVILRAAYRGYETGELQTDLRFSENLSGARAAGLKVGVYVFSQAINEEEAAEEARFVLELLDGTVPDLPVYFDWEYVGDARADKLSRKQLTQNAQVFCDTVGEAGCVGGVYFNVSAGYFSYELGSLSEQPFWLARYRNDPGFYYAVGMWQYSQTGNVPGIEGDVDLDLMFAYKTGEDGSAAAQ